MSTTKRNDKSNGRTKHCRCLVTYANRNGIQRILACPTIDDAVDTLRAIALSLGFTDLSGASSPAFPVAIWTVRNASGPFERVFPIIVPSSLMPSAQQAKAGEGPSPTKQNMAAA